MINKLDFINYDLLGTLVWAMVFSIIIYCVVAAMISFALSEKIAGYASEQMPSFVLLTRRAIEAEERVVRRYEKNWKTFWAAFAVAVAAGIIGNVATWLILS